MRVNLDTTKVENEWNSRIKKASKEYRGDRLKQEYKNINAEIEIARNLIQEDVIVARAAIEEELKTIKKPEVPRRSFDAETISVLAYFSKIVKTNIALAGESNDALLRAVEEMAGHEDEKMRTAFVDSFYEVLSTARDVAERSAAPLQPIKGGQLTEAEGAIDFNNRKEIYLRGIRDAIESRLFSQYEIAKSSLLTAAQNESQKIEDEKQKRLELEDYHISFNLPLVEQRLLGIQTEANKQMEYIQNEKQESLATSFY